MQLDTRPTGTDISSPMSEPIGRGSGHTAGTIRKGTVMEGQRRVRHEVADAARLISVSFALSVAGAVVLGALSQWVQHQ